MPEGSSSAAPVISPGPSPAKNRSTRAGALAVLRARGLWREFIEALEPMLLL